MIIGLLSLLSLAAASVRTPRLFCYWESWNQFKVDDFANELDKVPIKTANRKGCDVVIVAFNDFKLSTDCDNKPIFGFINEQSAADLAIFGFERLRLAIAEVHRKGAKVYVSLGGSTFTTTGVINTPAQAVDFIDHLAHALKSYGLDGVDFSHINSKSSAAIQTRMIKRLKSKYPAYKIMYTIPAMGSYFAPWSTVLEDARDKIDYVQTLFYDYNWLGYNLDTDLAHLLSVIKHEDKIVIGIMPGCHDAPTQSKNSSISSSSLDTADIKLDAPADALAKDISHDLIQDAVNEHVTTVKKTRTLTQKVIDEGYSGIAIWSANRDTDKREGYEGCPYFTGEPDATFIRAVSKRFEIKASPA
jgi:chitinase